jgi:hypothetical protein
MNEENEGCVRGTAEQGEEAATENQTKRGGRPDARRRD